MSITVETEGTGDWEDGAELTQQSVYDGNKYIGYLTYVEGGQSLCFIATLNVEQQLAVLNAIVPLLNKDNK